jgi:hypothetical protein
MRLRKGVLPEGNVLRRIGLLRCAFGTMPPAIGDAEIEE